MAVNNEGWQAEAELDAGDAPPAFFAEDAARAPCQVVWERLRERIVDFKRQFGEAVG